MKSKPNSNLSYYFQSILSSKCLIKFQNKFYLFLDTFNSLNINLIHISILLSQLVIDSNHCRLVHKSFRSLGKG